MNEASERYLEKTLAARALASERKIVHGICACGCGQEFDGTTKRRYFSGLCRAKASRDRRITSVDNTFRPRFLSFGESIDNVLSVLPLKEKLQAQQIIFQTTVAAMDSLRPKIIQ